MVPRENDDVNDDIFGLKTHALALLNSRNHVIIPGRTTVYEKGVLAKS